jgi:hypothetical protein
MGERASRGVGEMVMKRNFLSYSLSGLVPSHVRRGRVRVGGICAARLPVAPQGKNSENLVPHPPLADERRPPPTNGRGKIHSPRCGAAFLILALSGCTQLAPAPAPRPVLVQVPVATPIYCQVPPLNPPILAIASLTPDSPPADTVRSYASSVEVLKGAVRERDSILEGCAAPPATGPSPQASIVTPPASHPTDNAKPAQVSIPTRLLTTMGKLFTW